MKVVIDKDFTHAMYEVVHIETLAICLDLINGLLVSGQEDSGPKILDCG